MAATLQSHTAMIDLAIDLGVDLGVDSPSNQWGGFDIRLPGGILRTACDGGSFRVLSLTPNGVLLTDASFSGGTPYPAVLAYAHGLAESLR